MLKKCLRQLANFDSVCHTPAQRSTNCSLLGVKIQPVKFLVNIITSVCDDYFLLLKY